MRLLILTSILAMAGCDQGRIFPPTTMTDEEIALHMQCNDRHGLMAMSHGPHGEWVECYQGKKRVWRVKVRRETDK